MGSHHARAVCGAYLGGVFAEGDVADPVQAVLDVSVAADQGGEFGSGGLLSGQAGDRVGDLGGPVRTVWPTRLADDLDGLPGVRAHDPSRDVTTLRLRFSRRP